jgi:DNA-binding transcriptional LysR family regulator
MNLQDLALLVTAARAGSFAAAAKSLGADPSSVSRGVARLEAELGVRLFQRTTRRLSLTEAGHLYLARLQPLLEELDQIGVQAREAQTEPAGTLRLTASATFGQALVAPLLPAFRAGYPKIGLECLFTDAVLDLVADRIDLAVRLAPAIEGDVVAAKLIATRYRLVASPTYLDAAPPLHAPDRLGDHRLILFPFRPFRSNWIFRDAQGRTTEVDVRGDLVLSPAGAILEAARMGLGIALLPNYLTDPDVAAGRLRRLLPEFDVTATTFETGAWLVYPSRAYLPAKTRAMIDFLRANLRWASAER